MVAKIAGRQGRKPMQATARSVSTRSRWSLNIVKNFTLFQICNTGSIVAGMALVLLVNISAARCDGWNPFSSDKTKQDASKVTKTSAKSTESTSVLDKIGTGTKNTWNKLTGKQPEVKKKSQPGIVYPKSPTALAKEKEPTSWLPWTKTEEKKPTSVNKYLKETERPKLE
jgi:hypothetical protein